MKLTRIGAGARRTMTEYLEQDDNGYWVPCRYRLALGMTWIGWLNYCVLQWFGIRLGYEIVRTAGLVPGAHLRVKGAYWRWPLKGWYLTWRHEVIIPSLLSLPVVTALVLVVLWLRSVF